MSVVGRAWPAAVILVVIAVQPKHQKRLGVQLAGPLGTATLDTTFASFGWRCFPCAMTPRRLQQLATMATLATLVLTTAAAASAREAADPIALTWVEGDVAGYSRILAPDAQKTLGTVEYHQYRKGDVLEVVRVARFSDGSSDEDRATARVGKTLETVGGRSIIRDTHGKTIVDLTIDVAGGHITGFSGVGKDRETYDQRETLSPGTYFGPLIAIVVKNFDANATADKLVFQTVVATPKPRVLDMELTRKGPTTLAKPGGPVEVTPVGMLPTVNFLVDPIIQRFAPETTFVMQGGKPPALVRFAGPRNYAGQKIIIE